MVDYKFILKIIQGAQIRWASYLVMGLKAYKQGVSKTLKAYLANSGEWRRFENYLSLRNPQKESTSEIIVFYALVFFIVLLLKSTICARFHQFANSF